MAVGPAEAAASAPAASAPAAARSPPSVVAAVPVPAAQLAASLPLPWLRAVVGATCSAAMRFFEPRYKRVQHVTIAIGHMCTVTEKDVVYKKKCGRCTVSVNGCSVAVFCQQTPRKKRNMVAEQDGDSVLKWD